MTYYRKFLFLICCILFVLTINAQMVPKVYKNIYFDEKANNYYFKDPDNGSIHYADTSKAVYRLCDFSENPVPFDSGFLLKTGAAFAGSVLFGLIDTKYNLPKVVYCRNSVPVKNGIAKINLVASLSGLMDITDWKKKGTGKVGYRYINSAGSIVFDGSFVFGRANNTFLLDTCFVEDPSINNVTDNSAIIRFTTNFPIKPLVKLKSIIEEKTITGVNGTVHEILLNGLKADTPYQYQVELGNYKESGTFTTFQAAGSKAGFVFGYASDCRSGQGGNERNIMGVNNYVMSKIAALLVYEKARFAQITGDLVSGYATDEQRLNLEYHSFKNTIAPYSRQIPFYIGMGNHEAIAMQFGGYNFAVDKFPFNDFSQEKLFSEQFVNPTNGPISEDGSKLDPDPKTKDFPDYGKSVYYYTCGNVAMVVLNSEYLYTQNAANVAKIGGNIHGYIMDAQLKWLAETLDKLEKNKQIEHIFVSFHAPAFPNGGHVGDAMYYGGNNKIRPYIGNNMADKGIIERRDELLDLMINKSRKVVAILAGDEHNYSRMLISPETIMYDNNYSGTKLSLTRSIWQITNGAAGAPYYGQEETPWSASVEKFAVQYALCLFTVDGNDIKMRVINPETLETIEEVKLK